jgi:cell division protein FtsB
MTDRKGKNKNSRARLIILSIIGLVLVFSIFPRARTIYELSLRKDDLLQQKRTIEVYNEELTIKLKQSEEPQAVERIAREKLGMIKPGEKYIMPVEE